MFHPLPCDYLNCLLPAGSCDPALRAYQEWWQAEGRAISDATDRAGTPWLQMFDRAGRRIDAVQFAPEYWRAVQRGYQAGVVWRAFSDQSLRTALALEYITAYYDPGLACPYTVSLATAVSLDKYGSEELRSRFLPRLLDRQGAAWQGATWMTEIRGGSDLGANVDTVARRDGDAWRLTGDKYFASNVGAELAVVAARPEGAAAGVRGLALFLLPRNREDGSLNYLVRRLKNKVATRSVPTGEVELRDSRAWLLGPLDRGVYLILEVLNLSRVADALGSVAVAHRALAEARAFAGQRVAFGRPVLHHPLLARQFADRERQLDGAFQLAWRALELLDEVGRETPPYSERYHLFRLVAHLAKYWTSDLAPQIARWAMEVHGALGILEEFPVERWFREAMVLTIWEGTSHRQILDGLEVAERKGVHRPLLQMLGGNPGLERRLEDYFAAPAPERESGAEEVFRALAEFAAAAI